MKKLINIKSTKKLMESSIKVGDANYSNRLRKRLVDTSRALELAKEALKKAEQNGQTSLVAQLKARIAELEDLLANYNVDRIQQDTPSGNQGQDSPAKGDRMKQGGQESGSESDEGDEGEENQKDSQNNDPGEESEESGEGEENQKNNQNKDPEEEGEESESKEGDDEENDPEDEGEGEGNDSDEDSEEDNQKGKKSDKDENGDGQDPESDDGDKNDEDSDSDDSNEGGGGDPTDRETDDDGADSSSQKSKSSKNKNNDKEDSEDGDDEEDSDDDSDDTSDDDSESGNSKSKSNSKKQNKSDDSDDEEQESDKSKSKLSLDDDDSNGSGDDDDPILNPFADEEDIPNMPPQGVGGGKFPREATADETIELLKTLKGEGKLGAIDALKELIASRKAAANESLKAKSTKPLTEAVKGLRDMTDGLEWNPEDSDVSYYFSLPERYALSTLEDVKAAADALPWDEEGYVCVDKNFNRCKIKSPAYVLAHHARSNGVITNKRLIEVVLRNEVNEFCIYCSEYEDRIKEIQFDMIGREYEAHSAVCKYCGMNTKKEMALAMKEDNIPDWVQGFCFRNFDKETSWKDYTGIWSLEKWEKVLEV
jgi:hypothetical protein